MTFSPMFMLMLAALATSPSVVHLQASVAAPCTEKIPASPVVTLHVLHNIGEGSPQSMLRS